MAATVAERTTPRQLTNLQAQRHYLIKGATDELNALSTFYAWIIANQEFVGNCLFSENDSYVDEIEGLTGTYYGTAVWKVLDLSFQPANQFSIGFDIGGESQRITHSISTIASYPGPSGNAPDHNGAINVNEDGTVDGTDIVVPQATYHVTYTFADNIITTSWLRGIAGIVGKSNLNTFQGFNECELLLSKVSGQKRQDGLWDVDFGFAISLNETGLTVGGVSGISKKGWQYVWVQWETTVVDSDLAKQAKAVYVEQTYYEADYTALGIPSNWAARL